jgi:hypothetical protein
MRRYRRGNFDGAGNHAATFSARNSTTSIR